MPRIIQIYYQDHNMDTIPPNRVSDPPSCLCSTIGEVVYEDRDWIRLCHSRNDLGGEAENLEVVTIRKNDVIQLQELAAAP